MSHAARDYSPVPSRFAAMERESRAASYFGIAAATVLFIGALVAVEAIDGTTLHNLVTSLRLTSPLVWFGIVLGALVVFELSAVVWLAWRLNK